VIDYQHKIVNAGLLPMTLDVNAWNNYLLTGQSSDGLLHPVGVSDRACKSNSTPVPLWPR